MFNIQNSEFIESRQCWLHTSFVQIMQALQAIFHTIYTREQNESTFNAPGWIKPESDRFSRLYISVTSQDFSNVFVRQKPLLRQETKRKYKFIMWLCTFSVEGEARLNAKWSVRVRIYRERENVDGDKSHCGISNSQRSDKANMSRVPSSQYLWVHKQVRSWIKRSVALTLATIRANNNSN